MTINQCKKFDYCSVPLCPMDKQSLIDGLWYPDEDICSLRKFSGRLMVKNQKKIQKVVEDKDLYFTSRMLNRNLTVTKNLKGLDPEKAEKSQLEAWIRSHQGRKQLSDAEKIRRKNQLGELNTGQ